MDIETVDKLATSIKLSILEKRREKTLEIGWSALDKWRSSNVSNYSWEMECVHSVQPLLEELYDKHDIVDIFNTHYKLQQCQQVLADKTKQLKNSCTENTKKKDLGINGIIIYIFVFLCGVCYGVCWTHL